jgi:single-strand DNA-binding protein
MAASLNKVFLIGNLVRDPEIRYIASGSAVVKFRIAVNRWSKQNKETDFVDIVAWEKLAETCNTYLKKGMQVLVVGRLSIRQYDDKDGNKRTATEVVISEMQMLDKRDGGNGEGYGSFEGGSRSATVRGGDSFEPEQQTEEEEIPF